MPSAVVAITRVGQESPPDLRLNFGSLQLWTAVLFLATLVCDTEV